MMHAIPLFPPTIVGLPIRGVDLNRNGGRGEEEIGGLVGS
jgi:hypothetical protein